MLREWLEQAKVALDMSHAGAREDHEEAQYDKIQDLQRQLKGNEVLHKCTISVALVHCICLRYPSSLLL